MTVVHVNYLADFKSPSDTHSLTTMTLAKASFFAQALPAKIPSSQVYTRMHDSE